MGLAAQSRAAVLVEMAIFSIAYGSRIKVEEKVLKKELGTSDVEYMKRTNRVIPKIV